MQLGEVFIARPRRNIADDVLCQCFRHDHLDVHFGLALQPRYAFGERALVATYCLAQSLVRFEDCAEFEWQYRAITEAITHHPCVVYY